MLFLPCIRSSTNCSCVGQTRIPQAAGGPKRVLSLMEAGWSFAAAQSPPKRGGGRFYPGLQLERVQGETHDLWAQRNRAVPCACTTRHLGSKTEQGLFKTWRGEGSTVRQQTPQAELCGSPVQSRVLRCYCYQWYNSLKCHRFAFRCQAETAELTVREVTFSFQGTGSKILLSFVLLLREKILLQKPRSQWWKGKRVPCLLWNLPGCGSAAVTVKHRWPVRSPHLQVWALPISVADGRAEDKQGEQHHIPEQASFTLPLSYFKYYSRSFGRCL